MSHGIRALQLANRDILVVQDPQPIPPLGTKIMILIIIRTVITIFEYPLGFYMKQNGNNSEGD